MLLMAPRFAYAALLLLLAFAPAEAQTMSDGLRVVYDFKNNPDADYEIELTRDSVRFLSASWGPERRLVGGRALSPGERDSAETFMALTGRWSGYRKYACQGAEGYAFSLWSDSLLLACDNCFSCTGGMSLPDARVMARLGKMTLWLYRMRETSPAE